ncbi:MAG: hypothetical protein AB7P21_25745 [Lautropia sp.]
MTSVVRVIVGWLLRQAVQQPGAMRAVATEAVDDLRDRGALLALEGRADLVRGVRWLLVAFVACLAGFASLSWVGAAFILLSWDTANRDLAVIAVAGAWVCVAACCVGWLRANAANAPAPLARSRALLAEDLAMLRRALRDAQP